MNSSSVNILNILSLSITLLSLFFSFWIYMRYNSKKKVEEEKITNYKIYLSNLKNMMEAICEQSMLIANMSERDETEKKELKHLSISMLITMKGVTSIINESLNIVKLWKFGVPSQYISLTELEKIQKKEEYSVNDSLDKNEENKT